MCLMILFAVYLWLIQIFLSVISKWLCYIEIIKMQHPRYFDNTLSDQEDSDVLVSSQRNYVSTLLQIISKNSPATPENCEGGLYVGAAGIAYAFYHVAQTGDDKKSEYLLAAEKYAKVSLNEIKKMDPSRNGIGASLLLGHLGVYAVSIMVCDALGLHNQCNESIQEFLSMQKYCEPIQFFKHGSDELFVGRAGYLAAAYTINKHLRRMVVSNDMIQVLCSVIIESGRRMSQYFHHECPLLYSYYETEYLGAGHGLASILLMLLNFPPCYVAKHDIEKDIKMSVDYLLRCEENGNYPPVANETRDDWNELIHWCHGAPGVIYLLVKSYMIWKEQKYLDAALRCGEVIWAKGLLRKGPGLCHGIAGNGYAFLLLFRLTRDEKYLRRARQFAAFMQTEEFKSNSRVPDAPYSLFEGIAGTACFLSDLAKPDDAHFPFMEIHEL
nr:lanC-like protein 3 isoform X1 [Hydra vulgaris]